MIIAIPSYRRTRIVQEKTLAYLEHCGVQAGDISIFVADDAELDEYRAALAPIYSERIFVTAPTLRASRQVAHERYLPEGAEVVWMDDDVTSLVRRVNEKEVEEISDFPSFVAEGFALARRVGANLWGVYPITNPYFMKTKVRTGLWHIVGATYGIVNTRDPVVDNLEFGDAKEDYERSLRHYERDGTVLRLDFVAVKTAYYRGDAGGINDRTAASVEQNVRALERRWPGLVHRRRQRKSDYPEILIRA